MLFSAQFLSEGTPDGSRWTDVVSTVYSGFFTKFNPRTDNNVLLTQLSDPYPDRDFLCIVDGCYTLEFIYDENVTVDDLSFTIQAMGTEHVLEVSLLEFDTILDFCVNGTEYDHNPTAAPTISAFPTFLPSSGPTFLPSGAPSSAPSGAPSASPTGTPTACPSAAPSGLPWDWLYCSPGRTHERSLWRQRKNDGRRAVASY